MPFTFNPNAEAFKPPPASAFPPVDSEKPNNASQRAPKGAWAKRPVLGDTQQQPSGARAAPPAPARHFDQCAPHTGRADAVGVVATNGEGLKGQNGGIDRNNPALESTPQSPSITSLLTAALHASPSPHSTPAADRSPIQAKEHRAHTPGAPCTPNACKAPSGPGGPSSNRNADTHTTPRSSLTAAMARCGDGGAATPASGTGTASRASLASSPVVADQVGTAINEAEARAYGMVGPKDFKAIREIGQGAFGKVYLVQSRLTKRYYAMKVLNKQRVLQKEQVSYAMSERDVMCNLEHPYLVALRFAFQTNHRLFLVMDYIEGGHLWLHMKSGFLAEDVARVFVAEIVLALNHLHSLNIAHRDLKPENILLDSDNHCRLTDFGLAKRELGDDRRAHTMVGTIDYMAPEVVKGDGHGLEVDWWSLGVLMYEMLFARLPFAPAPTKGPKGKGPKGKDPKLDPGNEAYKTEVKKRIQNSKVTWPRGPYINIVSNDAKNLIQRLLCKSPKERIRGDDLMRHPWFKSLNWPALRARQVPSPLRSSIFAGAPDKISERGMDPAPIEFPCAKLEGYLFEKDTPVGTPKGSLLTSFTGFSYVHQSELAAAVAKNVDAF